LETAPRVLPLKPAIADRSLSREPAGPAVAAPSLRLAATPLPDGFAGSRRHQRRSLQLSDLPQTSSAAMAVIRGDYERQIVDLEKQRKLAGSEARDRSATEAESLRRDLEHAVNQVAEGEPRVHPRGTRGRSRRSARR